MSLSINLAPLSIDDMPSAETQPEKIIELCKSLSYADTFHAATRLLEEIKLLNRQKIAVNTRIKSLELYRKTILEVSHDLEALYGNTPVPMNEEAKNYASISEAIWLEVGYGYKRALVDLKHSFFNLNGSKQDTLVILRAIEALKNEAQVNYLSYSQPSEHLWSDLHKIYYHALQLSIESIEVNEHTTNNSKTVTAIYIQALLLHLASPHKLDKTKIRKLIAYVPSLVKYAQLRGIGKIEQPIGVFLIELDSKKPPVPYLKNKNTPNVDTDILLLTIEVARQIHQQLKFIQENKENYDGLTPIKVLDVFDEDLLIHLIKYFGTTTQRLFPRVDIQDTATMAIGLDLACILFRSQKRNKDDLQSVWEIMNVSPTGYALKTQDTHDLTIEVGDIVCIKETPHTSWTLAYVVWLITKVDHIEAGIKLIAPTAQSIAIKSGNALHPDNALLLPAIKTLDQPESIVLSRGSYTTNSILEYTLNQQSAKLEINRLIERSASFERYEFSLIDDDLS